MNWDGHTHTPYCPHGSQRPLEEYVEQAIKLGFKKYSFTEHAPLPASFPDPVPEQDSAMKPGDIDSYLEECERMKAKYKGRIELLVGLEVDYVAGYEKETKSFLDFYGSRLQDSILSVHFLPVEQTWTCLDFSAELFEQDLIRAFPTVDHIYLYYYQILEQAVQSDLGRFKPRRIGHFNLIEKFKKKFPSVRKEIWWEQAIRVLHAIRSNGYQLDFNTAGYRKLDCLERYPSDQLLEYAISLDIPLVFGSDAHHPHDVGYRHDDFVQHTQ